MLRCHRLFGVLHALGVMSHEWWCGCQICCGASAIKTGGTILHSGGAAKFDFRPRTFAKILPMGYAPAMRTKLLSVSSGIIFLSAAAFWLHADEVEMQNGDRYFGKVVSVSADTVALDSEVLGKINLRRKNVASLAFGTNAPAPKEASVATFSAPTNLATAASPPAVAGTNADLSAALRNLGADTNFTGKIRDQILAGNPQATAKYEEMVSGLLSGSVSMDDVRREAQSDADQLRALKRDLGPDAGDSLDGYLDVLDDFLNESNSAAGPTNASSAAPKTKVQNH
jgi:hypothetical protein